VSAPARAAFTPTRSCWICGGEALRPVARAIFELSAYGEQDPELAAYTGASVALVRCTRCGFSQPAALPALPGYFDRMYDQRWSDAWLEEEYRGGTKDPIFRATLAGLERRLPPGRRRLLDLGAHVGRLLALARDAGWEAEGIELNPRTSAYALRTTGLPVHRADLRDLSEAGRRWDAVTLVDVLEHIPDPVGALEAVRGVLAPDGVIAVKVPHGPNQLRKERLRGVLFRGYRPTVADNLVHVSHFTPSTLRAALERAGFDAVEVESAPAVRPSGGGTSAALRGAFHRAVAGAARVLPGGARSPLAMNLQAYARVSG
jgi:SAM-dependent methyltransferase